MSAASPPLGLGEIVRRVRDLAAMQRFYQDVFGLTLLRRFERMAFLRAATGRAATGRAGRTTILALFDQALPSPVWKTRREARGLSATTAEHPWLGWRSLYVADPEGIVVELVGYDASLWRSRRQQTFTIRTYALHLRGRSSCAEAGRSRPARRTIC